MAYFQRNHIRNHKYRRNRIRESRRREKGMKTFRWGMYVSIYSSVEIEIHHRIFVSSSQNLINSPDVRCLARFVTLNYKSQYARPCVAHDRRVQHKDQYNSCRYILWNSGCTRLVSISLCSRSENRNIFQFICLKVKTRIYYYFHKASRLMYFYSSSMLIHNLLSRLRNRIHPAWSWLNIFIYSIFFSCHHKNVEQQFFMFSKAVDF